MIYVTILLLSLFSSGLSNSMDFFITPNLEDVEWPSCEELRILWFNLNYLKDYGELTNEIPLIPTDLLQKFQKYHHHARIPLSHRQRNMKVLLPNTSKGHKSILSSPNMKTIEPVLPPREIFGIPSYTASSSQHKSKIDTFQNGNNLHGDFQVLESAEIPFFHDPMNERRMALPSAVDQTISAPNYDDYGFFDDLNSDVYGHEENVGSFGDFSKEDETPMQQKTNIRTVKLDNSGWHSQPTSIGSRFELPAIQDSCEKVERQSCSSNDNCACVGWKILRCVNERCHNNQEAFTGHMKGVGAWHNGPLPFNQLGIVKRRNKRSKSTEKKMSQ